MLKEINIFLVKNKRNQLCIYLHNLKPNNQLVLQKKIVHLRNSSFEKIVHINSMMYHFIGGQNVLNHSH